MRTFCLSGLMSIGSAIEVPRIRWHRTSAPHDALRRERTITGVLHIVRKPAIPCPVAGLSTETGNHPRRNGRNWLVPRLHVLNTNVWNACCVQSAERLRNPHSGGSLLSQLWFDHPV